jgi:hypothetical protein
MHDRMTKYITVKDVCSSVRRITLKHVFWFCPGVWGNVNAAVVLRPCWCCKCISHPGFFF